MRRTFHSLLFALLAGALAASAVAQTTTATLRGKVTVEGGTELPNALIQATGTASGFVKSVASGARGAYQLGGLTPGEYKIVVSAEGFDSHSETLRARPWRRTRTITAASRGFRSAGRSSRTSSTTSSPTRGTTSTRRRR